VNTLKAKVFEHFSLIGRAMGSPIRLELIELLAQGEKTVDGLAASLGVPIANAVLTCETEAQAEARAEDKGRDAAQVAVEMANLLDEWS
jgi:6,7-dimethyl-8-ribityllumazine synthase